MKIRIGTRSSKLALWQANFVASQLQINGISSEIILIETKGDKILDKSLSKIGSKGIFTEELENQLRLSKIDIAVHSAKDVQSSLDSDLELIAFSKREKANDVLLSMNPNLNLFQAVKIGTSSTRRRAQIKNLYPNIELVEMRGNLQTRLKKLENGEADGIILAYAGVYRMEMTDYVIHEFNLSELTPAAGQGSIAIQCLTKLQTAVKKSIISSVNDLDSYICVSCERSFLKEMEGGCSIPIFAHAIQNEDKITFIGGIISLDGQKSIKETIVGNANDHIQIGKDLATKLNKLGAQELLSEIKRTINNE